MSKQRRNKFVLLHEKDNVLACCEAAWSGEHVEIDGKYFTLNENIAVGHKLARNKILTGEKILKHGAAIGSATQDLEIACHVHLHNIKSDYIACHTRAGHLNKNQHLEIEENKS